MYFHVFVQPCVLKNIYTLEHYKPDTQRVSGSVFKGLRFAITLPVNQLYQAPKQPRRGLQGVRIQMFTGVKTKPEYSIETYG